MFSLGIDVGSTTAKLVLLDVFNDIRFKAYRRHNARVGQTITDMLKEILEQHGDISISVSVTGTAGMGLAERNQLHFIQEVVAASKVVEARYPEVKTLIDIGGEDGKIVLFSAEGAEGGKSRRPTIRMNGNCAGGTGAFIDQMATLLGVDVSELSRLSQGSSRTYPMASRCGVFAKTDVQTLMSRNISREDIVASVYRAVAFQTVSSLAHGADLEPKVMFIGGPLGFQPGLRSAFCSVLNIEPELALVPEDPELVPALGAALEAHARAHAGSHADALVQASVTKYRLVDFIKHLGQSSGVSVDLSPRLPRLFESERDFVEWQEQKNAQTSLRLSPQQWLASTHAGDGLFIGIDSGSRSSKMVLIDSQGAIVHSFYASNDGDPLSVVARGLREMGEGLVSAGISDSVIRVAASTGYGEDLLKTAFRLDYGIVETLAHFRAARSFDPEVSFILDIGGQDMKAISVRDQVIHHIELNEACSSGTGSFIEGFARNLEYKLEDFALLACRAQAPCDLGTRCTVFMNSKVKQSLREGAQAGDISAGLAYSVIRNCFYKVLKIHDSSVLGKHVIAQGGTFRNPAVLRALELHLGMPVRRPDIAELMGAYGAALSARDRWVDAGKPAHTSSFIGFGAVATAITPQKKQLTCNACENLCAVTRLDFGQGKIYYTGNKCERVFSNGPRTLNPETDGPTVESRSYIPYDMLGEKTRLLFDRSLAPKSGAEQTQPVLKIGIPRVLNMFEDFPFWAELFTTAGFEVVLSDPSTLALAEPGYRAVMSENVCFPAKIVGGHILNLVQKKVDRVFFPMVRHDRQEFSDALNSFNCPVVTGYPEVIRSALDIQRHHGIPFDHPPVSFSKPELIRAFCIEYLGTLGVSAKNATQAWHKAERAWLDFHKQLAESGRKALEACRASGRLGVLLLCRPYHADSLINHRLSRMFNDLGVDVFTDDIIPPDERGSLDGVQVLTQWTFPNRYYDAALWARDQAGLEVVQLNSFGCGPDAMAVDEVRALLQERGKNPTLIRVDEVSSPGSLRLRVRSLIESVRQRDGSFSPRLLARSQTPLFEVADRMRTIIAPMFSPFYTDFIVESFRHMGYRIDVLPMPDWQSVQAGLTYCNHDICYPATILIGDILKAFSTGRYDPATTAVAITQTGGQCRASSYASLLKKALVDAGYTTVPVVTLSAGTSARAESLNPQPGFQVSPVRFGLNAFFGVLYADAIAKLYYAASVRETEGGAAWACAQDWLKRGVQELSSGGPWRLLKLVGEAARDFNKVLAHTRALPKVGVVGEIYVKFNPFANNYLTDWLRDHELEADVPPLINFFLQRLVTDAYNQAHHIDKKKPVTTTLFGLGERVINHVLARVNRSLEEFRLPITPFHTMRHLAEGAQCVLNLINQYGESWLIAGDIASFIEAGTHHVVCLQPFGCIANHIIAKGVEKRLRETYPTLDLLFLDMDAGSSEVNLSNRLEFLARSAKQDHISAGKQPRAEIVSHDHAGAANSDPGRAADIRPADPNRAGAAMFDRASAADPDRVETAKEATE